MSESQQVVEQAAASQPQSKPQPRQKPGQLPPYHVVLLDDNEHTYDYVVGMLQSIFGHAEQQALLLAQTVDHTGRAIVCTTHKERAELKRDQILSFGCDFRISNCKTSMKALIEPAEG